MKLRISQFCSLISSPDWQRWLYEYNKEIYNKFMIDLRNTTGCGRNREIMTHVLKEIENTGGSQKLMKFLRNNYPYILNDDQIQHGWESNFTSGLLTFPHRKVIDGPSEELEQKVNRFLSDKIKYESVIVNGRAYVEYLEKGDEAVLAKLPNNKWILRKSHDGKNT